MLTGGGEANEKPNERLQHFTLQPAARLTPRGGRDLLLKRVILHHLPGTTPTDIIDGLRALDDSGFFQPAATQTVTSTKPNNI